MINSQIPHRGGNGRGAGIWRHHLGRYVRHRNRPGLAAGALRPDRPDPSLFLLAIITAYVFALCIKGLGETPHLYSIGLRPVSDLINSPNLFSVVVAVLAGIVGVVSLAESRANALIGVFISITTIPAAADIGVSLAYHSWAEARGSALQLLLNVGLLIIIGALAVRLLRRIW